MRRLQSIAPLAFIALILAGPTAAATPAAIYQRNVTCAAAMAALAARLPPTSSAKARDDARDSVSRERTFAIDTGTAVGAPAPQTDRLIAQRRDAILARAAKSANTAKTNRNIFIDTVECEVDQLGDAIQKAKAERAARGAKR